MNSFQYIKKYAFFILSAALLLTAGCGGSEPAQSTGETTEILLSDEITVSGSGASVQGNTVKISAGGTYELSGTAQEGRIEIDTAGSVNLILSNAHLSSSNGAAIYIENAESTTLTLADGTTNTVADAEDYTGEDKGAIYSRDDLEITGEGSLTVQGNFKHGIVSNDTLTISSGSLTIDAVTDGLHANDLILVSGGDLTITASSDCIESEDSIVIDGGALTLQAGDDGVTAANDLTVNGGEINISACYEGLESKKTLTINDGDITIYASDDALNAGTSMILGGGQIYLNAANGDAIDSNGTIEIHGGLIIALGGNSPEGGIDCDHNKFLVTGGTLIATGGSNSSPSEESAQPVVLLGSASAGDIIRIEDAGSEILTFEVSKDFRNMVYTSPALALSTEYTLYTSGGSISGGTDFYGLYTGAGYTAGDTSETFVTESIVTTLSGASSGGFGGGMPGGGNRPGGDNNRGGSQAPPDGAPSGEGPSGSPPSGEMPERGAPSGDFDGERPERPSGGMRPDDETGGSPPDLPEQSSAS